MPSFIKFNVILAFTFYCVFKKSFKTQFEQIAQWICVTNNQKSNATHSWSLVNITTRQGQTYYAVDDNGNIFV